MRKYDYLLIDADETILDFNGSEREAFIKILQASGLGETPELFSTYKTLNRKFWIEIEKGELPISAMVEGYRFKKFFEEIGCDFDYKIVNEIFLTEVSNSLLVIDHAEEVLSELAKDYKLYCITNGFERTAYGRLQATGFINYFTDVFVSETIGYQKPSVEYFTYALDKAGIKDKDRVLVIGDSLRGDMKGGINSGLSTCWYNPFNEENIDNIPIDYEIKDLREIFTIL